MAWVGQGVTSRLSDGLGMVAILVLMLVDVYLGRTLCFSVFHRMSCASYEEGSVRPSHQASF